MRLTPPVGCASSDVLEGGQKVYIKDEKTGETRWCKVCLYPILSSPLSRNRHAMFISYSPKRPCAV